MKTRNSSSAVDYCVVVIIWGYRSESGVRSFTRFTDYSWRGAKREFVHSVTVHVCCQENTFSVNHRRVIWSLQEAGLEASVAKVKSPEAGSSP